MQMRSFPLFLVCTEICEHQSVGLVTGVMTLCSTSSSSSSRSLAWIEIGTRRGGHCTGLAASSIISVTGPFRQPRVFWSNTELISQSFTFRCDGM